MNNVNYFIASCGELWLKAQNHEFVKALKRGDLPVNRFKYYLIQDYLYLIAYSRSLALACYKAPSLSLMTEMSSLLESTLKTEMQLHREYAAEFGISATELENSLPAPTMLAYTSYMLDIASRCDFLSNIVCILPCAVGYAEIGSAIRKSQIQSEKTEQGITKSNPYQRWIDIYSSNEFNDYSVRLIAITNQLSDGLPQSHINNLTAIFKQSTEYERNFWEMAWTMEEWLD